MHGVAFHRPARVYAERLPSEEIKIVPPQPPPSQQGGAASWIQYLLPVVGSLSSVVFILANPHPSPILFIGVGAMIFASVGGGFLTRSLAKRSQKKQAKAYREKYSRYLEQLSTRLDDILARQRHVSDRLYPGIDHLTSRVQQRAFLWERRPYDADFLEVRIGAGVVPLSSHIVLDTGSNPLADFDPELFPKAQAVVARYEQVDDAPLTIPLRSVTTCVVSGKHEATRALVRSMVCYIAASHAPDDVRILAAFPPDATREWSWLRWLPHTRRLRQLRQEQMRQGDPLCLMADSVEDFQALLASQIVPELERRHKIKEGKHDQKNALPPTPHFIIILDGFTPKGPLARIPLLDDLFRNGTDLGVTVICLVADRGDEPSLVQGRLEISPGGWMSFAETTFGGRRLEYIQPDVATAAAAENIARALAPLTLSDKEAQQDLAQDVQLLTLLGIPGPDSVAVTRSWQPRTRTTLLNVPIGMCEDGTPLLLDIKEAAEGGMGPHGLIIGATGSGKSELLRTIVTSLAITHDPETLSFVLADFKGGAAFADLASLPHAAGMISNLQSDLSQVDRMRASLFGEQERRQQMLREGGNLDNIRQYHAKRQQNPEMEPMPYLMIIVDEFAELLASRPDFLELFIAIGRVGRSLGMHLLLATQRLSEGRIQGLEGHLRYRICLRTFSAAESSAVLGTPDAFYLPSFPGIGYFKVDTNVYKMFKTALISTPYQPPVAQQVSQAIAVRRFTTVGKLVALGPDAAIAPVAHDSLRTDMDVVIERLLDDPQRQQRAAVHQVWLPPLPAQIDLDGVLARAGRQGFDGSRWPSAPPFGPLRVPIGLLDRPSEQQQVPMMLDFSGAGGHLALVGAPQSGKSTLLQTLVTAFIATHTPRDVQIYCIDLGGGLLRGLENAPHVGVVCGKGERDKIRRTVRQMRGIIEEREFFFREHRIDGITSYRARRLAGEFADAPFGDVFLVIDDLAQLQADIDQIDVELADLIATGLTYGVHVILASNRWADVRAKLRDNIGTRVELRLNDPVESEMGKAAAATTLSQSPPGRGIIKGGLQFQTALPRLVFDAAMRQQPVQKTLEQLVTRTRDSWHAGTALPIRLLPPLITLRDLPPATRDRGVPIGIDEFQLDLVYMDLPAAGPHFIIFGDGESGKTTLIRTWQHGLEQRFTPEEATISVIDYRRTSIETVDSPNLLFYACTPAMLKDGIEKLKAQLESRMLSTGNLTIEDLRNPRKWSGPHHYLLVDDYETIVTPAGNPLAPLVDSIAQARDIGFHLILARRVTGTSRTAFEPVFQRLKESGSPGLIMSGDPQEGALLGTQKSAALPPGRGFLVRRNQRTLMVQALFTEVAGR